MRGPSLPPPLWTDHMVSFLGKEHAGGLHLLFHHLHWTPGTLPSSGFMICVRWHAQCEVSWHMLRTQAARKFPTQQEQGQLQAQRLPGVFTHFIFELQWEIQAVVKLWLQKKATASTGRRNPCGVLVYFFTTLGKRRKLKGFINCPVGKVP